MPILLLDDVLSELDLHRGYYLMETISRAQQVLVTTTHLRDYTPEFLEAAMLWCVKAGTLRPLEADEVGE
jgi:recombinational DNA repair ATPase RecF